MLGLSTQQKLFCLAILKGATQAAAAKAAGYAGDDKQLRTVGSRTAKADKVRSFITWAERGGGAPDEPATTDQLRRRLSKIALGGDKNAAIRASEVLIRIETADREAAALRPNAFNPKAVLDAMCQLGPAGVICALGNARQYGMADWVPPPSAAARAVAAMTNALNTKLASLGLTDIQEALAAPPDYDQTPADKAARAFHETIQRTLPMWQSDGAHSPPAEAAPPRVAQRLRSRSGGAEGQRDLAQSTVDPFER